MGAFRRLFACLIVAVYAAGLVMPLIELCLDRHGGEADHHIAAMDTQQSAHEETYVAAEPPADHLVHCLQSAEPGAAAFAANLSTYAPQWTNARLIPAGDNTLPSHRAQPDTPPPIA